MSNLHLCPLMTALHQTMYFVVRPLMPAQCEPQNTRQNKGTGYQCASAVEEIKMCTNKDAAKIRVQQSDFLTPPRSCSRSAMASARLRCRRERISCRATRSGPTRRTRATSISIRWRQRSPRLFAPRSSSGPAGGACPLE